MEAAIALIVAAVFAYGCARALQKAPVPFYAAFALLGAVYASGIVGSIAPALELALIPFLRRASLAFGLFSVVMFVGVLPQGSALRKRLEPIRGKLSLLAAILVIVHVAGYAATYVANLASGAASIWVVLGLVVGLVVAVLLAILAATSISRIKSGMDAIRWKKIQRLAYPFYLLMYAHLAAMLLPSSMLGGNSLANLAVYTLVVAAYLVLRVSKAARDSGKR